MTQSRLDVAPRKSESEWEASLHKCQANWRKFQTKNNFSAAFEHYTDRLRLELAEALDAAAKENDRAVRVKVISMVSKMFQDTNKENNIDSCVRWLILVGLIADSEPSDDQGTADSMNHELFKMLVNAEPFLAFENPNNALFKMNEKSEGGNIWHWGCINQKAHGKKKKENSTPFHRAAANGNAKALKVMIESLKTYCEAENQKQKRGEKAYQRPMFYPTAKDPFLGVLRSESPDRKTALQLAAKAVQGKLETLEVLLSYPEVAEPPDTTFKEALESGAADIVERFLRNEHLVGKFVCPENIIRAMGKISQQQEQQAGEKLDGNEAERKEPNDLRIKIVHLLIGHAKTNLNSIFNGDVVEKIIALNLTSVWKDERLKELEMDKYSPLHLAVMHQNLEFVNLFVEEYKDAVTKRAELPETDGKPGYFYPLWFNNRKWDKAKKDWVKKKGSPEIRTALVIATIRQTKKMQELSEILRLSGEKARELCFDISLFNSKSYRLRDFVRSLIAHHENETLLKYEPTIKYARFPPMDLHPRDRDVFGEPVGRDHKEVFKTLKWLRKDKGVRSIIELKVPDRLVNPHNEEEIAKVVKQFGVEILDWRFLDLSLSVFADVRSQIRGLHLYTSGKRAVISHWMSATGLGCFTNLDFLRVHVIQEAMTKTACDKTCRLIRDGVKQVQSSRGLDLDFEVNTQPWNQKHDGLADLGDLAEKAFPSLSQFILKYRDFVTKIAPPQEFRPTRIAIIDNGIMSMSPATHVNGKERKPPRGAGSGPGSNGNMTNGRRPEAYSSADETDYDDDEDEGSEEDSKDEDNSQGDLSNQKWRDKAKAQRTLWSRIKLGRSFVDDDHQLSPWLFASDPHGTQMANLICAIDPACELYVAKVTDGCDGIRPHRVARAIEWAKGEGVDIISMSFAMLETEPWLEKAVADAFREGIIMLCSTHDQGSNVENAYPASMKPTWTVAACNEYGTLHRPINHDGFQYMLQGVNVPAGGVPFLDSDERISGSSVSTAIAAGLSSLILSCLRLANPNQEFKDMSRAGKVEEKLQDMIQDKSPKYVMLDKFGGLREPNNRGELIEFTGVLKKFEVEAPLH